MNKLGADFQKRASKLEASLKSVLSQHSNFFESLNFRYFGPTDGHDVQHLTDIFKDLKTIDGPKLLHCRTIKGKGYKYAEKDQTSWHATKGFIKETGESRKSSSDQPSPPKYQDVFGETIIELAQENDKIMGVTPAMPSGSSLKYMMQEMPDRAFDVGIAEQHSVTFSAGLATQGLRPFCNVYSTFLQRAYDQVIHDVAIQNLPVIFCLDRAGLVSGDGTTHHGAYDMAYLRCIPNMVIAAPMTEPELRHLMYTAQLDKIDFPFSMRYPRGKGITVDWRQPMKEIPIGTGRKLRDGEKIAILTIGKPGVYAQEACQQLNSEDLYPAHYDMRFVKPLDEELLHEVFQNYDKVVTVEDGCIKGGFGSAVLEFMADNGYAAQVKRLGIPDRTVMQGKPEKLHKECGYDPEGIMQAVRESIEDRVMVEA
jgi:1-deoxy-D-xylulose-5-phosphate synthase